ncbi:MAG: DegT/DnrJ/EryC1/StrS aminotransferase family protein [Phaeospirillum sp.]|nr:DegT/DnrJ/EryC1/StrS aminotransferase family protein [Phaeospirillum sp.]
MIPFLDLKAQYASIKEPVEKAVLDVLSSSAYVLGPAVADFEGQFAAYCGARHAVAVNSGTSALHLALLAAGIGPGDEVITTAMTFVATVAAIGYAGAQAVLVDADPVTWNLDPTKVEAAVTPRTKAIMPVHLHGLMADMDPLLDIAKRHGLMVIEDAAQAHGAEYKGRRAGSVGRIGCFSFYPGKNLGAYGEGGAVVTDDDSILRLLRMYRDWGQETKSVHELKGYNYRMEGVQGAVLGVKMAHIEDWTEGRRRVARIYDEAFDRAGVIHAQQPAGSRHVYHVYAILSADRARTKAALDKAGIGNGVHYPTPVHLQPAYAELGRGPGSFPVAERLAASFLSLPMFSELTDDQARTVADVVIAAERG